MIVPPNWCLIFFRDPGSKFDIARLIHTLKKAGLNVAGSQDLTVDWGTGLSLKVSLKRASYVEGFLRALVGRKRQYREHVKGCNTQIMIQLSDVDRTLDDINTLLVTQSALQNATGGLMYMSWNQSFSPPQGPPPDLDSHIDEPVPPIRPVETGVDLERERKWLTGYHTGYMIGRLLEGRLTDRKLRLFACACCRRIWSHIDDERSRTAVELAEAFADGLISDRQRAKAFTVAGAVPVNRDRMWPAAARETLTKQIAKYGSRVGQNSEWTLAREFAPEGELTPNVEATCLRQAGAIQADTLRDIFGNPFRRVELQESWKTRSVLELADAIYRDRCFDRLPLLADELVSAGCNEEAILAHCRSPGPHVRGCWAVDLVLGKK